MRRGVGCGAAFALPLALLAAAAEGQSIHGHVVDAETGAAIAGAEIRAYDGGRQLARVVSDTAGAFLVLLPNSGTYRLRVQMIGYAALENVEVAVESFSRTEVTLRLSTSAVLLDAIAVTARRRDPRHAATYEGFELRRELLPTIGNRRAIHRDEPEMRTASTIADVMKSLPAPRCLVVFVNGAVASQAGGQMLVSEQPVSSLEGIEFYRDGADAPLELRDRHHCARSGRFSVLGIWLRRTS